MKIILEKTLQSVFKKSFPFLLLVSFQTMAQNNSNDGIDTVINKQIDYLQFYNSNSLKNFYNAWNESKKQKLVIIHLGDSHIQNDIITGTERKELQLIHGDGGRGMTFPYSIAKTYSSIEYKSTFSGKWKYGKSLILPARVPLGVVGMACRIENDPNASFKFSFYSPIPNRYKRIRIFCKREKESYDIVLESDNLSKEVKIEPINGDTLPFVDIIVSSLDKDIKIKVKKNNNVQYFFEFYGMSIETIPDQGALVHNCGVGGAAFNSILYEELFLKQLPYFKPSLIILDFGTNDYIYGDTILPSLENTIITIIKNIRHITPNASILLTSTMDMIYRHRHVYKGVDFSELIKRIAKEKDCGFFDWFWIAGGRNIMPIWQEKGYAQADGIHLTVKGYKLKGKLIVDAMVNTISWMKKNPNEKSLILNIDSLKESKKYIIIKEQVTNDIHGKNKIMYTIRSGDNLGTIARKYHVKVSQLQNWNNLRGTKIIAGNNLIIYSNKK